MNLNRKSIILLIISLIVSILLLLFFLTDNGIFLFIVFLILWLLLIAVTIKPISKFHYWLIFRKNPTQKQLKIFMLSPLIIMPFFGLFIFLNIKYPTTPLNYFLRTIAVGFPLIGIYAARKYIKKIFRFFLPYKQPGNRVVYYAHKPAKKIKQNNFDEDKKNSDVN